MDRDEFNWHMMIARRVLLVAGLMFIAAVTGLITARLSLKGYLFIGLWLAIITYALASAIRMLRIGHRMQASGQITDDRTDA